MISSEEAIISFLICASSGFAVVNPCSTLTAEEDKNNLLKKYQLDGYFDEKGTFHGTGQMAQFLVMTGLTSDEVLDASSNPYADKLSRDDKQLEFKSNL